MKLTPRPLNNQDGFLIPTTLLLMVTLTIVGLLVTKDAPWKALSGETTSFISRPNQ